MRFDNQLKDMTQVAIANEREADRSFAQLNPIRLTKYCTTKRQYALVTGTRK